MMAFERGSSADAPSKVPAKAGSFFGSLSVSPFWSPPSPPMPKPKRAKSRPTCRGVSYIIPAQNVIPGVVRSSSSCSPRKKNVGSGREKKAQHKTQDFDSVVLSFADAAHSAEGGRDSWGERKCIRPAKQGLEGMLADRTIFDLGFDDDNGFARPGDKVRKASKSEDDIFD